MTREIAPALRPLEWLIGEWDALPDPAGATGASTSALVASGTAIVRTSRAEYPPGHPRAGRHDDVLLVYVEHGELYALYVDNEGHVVRYTVSTGDDRAVFTSADGPGPRFRLTYERRGPNETDVRFEVAPPGGELAPYLSGRIRRR